MDSSKLSRENPTPPSKIQLFCRVALAKKLNRNGAYRLQFTHDSPTLITMTVCQHAVCAPRRSPRHGASGSCHRRG
jgi:hypothetical protein